MSGTIITKHGPDRIRQTKTLLIWETKGLGKYHRRDWAELSKPQNVSALYASWQWFKGYDPREQA